MGETAYYNINAGSCSCNSNSVTVDPNTLGTISTGISLNNNPQVTTTATNYYSTSSWSPGYSYSTYSSTWDGDSQNTDVTLSAFDGIIKEKLKEIISTEDDMMPLIKRYLRDYLEEILDNPDIVFSNDKELQEAQKELEETKKELEETKSLLCSAMSDIYRLEQDIRDLKCRVSELENKPSDSWTTTSSPYITWATSTSDPGINNYATTLSALDGIQLNQLNNNAIGISQAVSNHPPEMG